MQIINIFIWDTRWTKNNINSIRSVKKVLMLLFLQISFLFKIYDNVFARCQVSCLNTNYHFCRFKLNWRSKTFSKYFNGKIAKSRQSCDLTLHVLVFCSASVKNLNCISNKIKYNITYIIFKYIRNSNALNFWILFISRF